MRCSAGGRVEGSPSAVAADVHRGTGAGREAGEKHLVEGFGRLAVALKVLFLCTLVAEVAWLVLATTSYEIVFSALGQSGVGLVHLLILCTLALSSGLLVLLEKRANTFNDPEHEWTLPETLYLLVLFASLFFGIYVFFGWYYSP